jgi:hypothetical protein
VGEGDLAGAAGDLNRIRELNALSLSAPPYAAWCQYLSGNYRQSIYEIQQVQRAGCTSPFSDGLEAMAMICEGTAERQVRVLEERAAGFQVQDVLAGALGYIHAVAGRKARAQEILDYLEPGGSEDTSHEPYAVALVLLGLGEHGEAVQRLEQSYREGSVMSLAFNRDPILARLRGEAAIAGFLRRISESAKSWVGQRNQKAL